MPNLRSTLFILCCSTTLALGCKKEEKAPAPAKGKTPAATKVQADKVKAPKDEVKAPKPAAKTPMEAFKECGTAFNAKDKERFSKCYAENFSWKMVDTNPAMAGTGREGTTAAFTGIWEAFPDLKSTPQLVMQNGKNFATIFHTEGTNTGAFAGMPATNKKMSIFETQVTTLNDQGEMEKAQYLSDELTMAAQLGMMENPMSPASETAWPATVWAVADGGETEAKNLALVKSIDEDIAKKDYESFWGKVADDVSFRYVAMNGMVEGKEGMKKGFEEWLAMASHDSTSSEIWAAGDWVVHVADHKHTMSTDFMGVPGTKGKVVSTRTIEYMQIADGKLKTHWVFENSKAFGDQLGLGGAPEEGAGATP